MNINKFFTLLILIIVIFPSCNDEEWLEDNGAQSNGFYEPTSTKDLEKMIEGSYWLMGGQSGWRGYHGNQQIQATFMSDEGWLFEEVANESTREWYYNRDVSNREEDRYEAPWDAGYEVLLQINTIIDVIENQGGFQDANAPEWGPRILGEAYFLRAYTNHELVKLFGKPYGADNSSQSIILFAERQDSPFDNKGLASVEDVYQQITADLDKAMELLPMEATNTNGPSAYKSAARVKKSAAYFLATRVYFAMHDYEKALEFANLTLEGDRYLPTEDPIATWDKNDPYKNSSETVWYYINSHPQTRWKAPVQSRFYGFTSDGRGGSKANTSQQLAVANSTLAKIGWDDPEKAKLDKRYTQLFQNVAPGTDPRTKYAALAERKVWPDKWYKAPHTNSYPYGLTSQLPLFRSAEIYLTRSILRYKAGDLAGATADLNVIKERAWNEEAGGAFVPVLENEITEDMIHNERLAEMLMEGDRIFYLQSLQMDIPAGDRTTGTYSWTEFGAPVPLEEAEKNPAVD